MAQKSVWRVIVLVALVAALVAGCGDDSSGGKASGGDDPDDNAKEVAESAGARVVAEALRVVIWADKGPDTDRRKVDVLNESVADLPGRPEVTGISDDDGDGLDDDGKVEVHVKSEVACLSISEAGRVDVTGGAC
jgi:hypothetical protein